MKSPFGMEHLLTVFVGWEALCVESLCDVAFSNGSLCDETFSIRSLCHGTFLDGSFSAGSLCDESLYDGTFCDAPLCDGTCTPMTLSTLLLSLRANLFNSLFFITRA